MDKKDIYEYVLNDLSEISLFRGNYDAENGSEEFMYGILTILEFIAHNTTQEKYTQVVDDFIENMIKSEGGNKND